MAAVTAYLGLGSNLGRRDHNLTEAIRCLGGGPGLEQACAITVLRASSIYETSPWGYEDQPDFLNCVLELSTRFSPDALLARIKAVEQEMGRRPGLRYGPRLIDIDILFYSDVTLDSPHLQIPHPRLHQRAFVLIPLAELNHRLVHPGCDSTVGDLARRVDGKQGVRVWGPPPGTTSDDAPHDRG